jgi:sugar O-acyltransferase (sialic acid O-acetyltransferase NeuD family)
MAEPLVLVGAGGLAREVLSVLADSSCFAVVGVVDDDPRLHGTMVLGVEVLGPIDLLGDHPNTPSVVVCLGRGATREQVVHRLDDLGVEEGRYATVLAPGVWVPSSCSVGPGSILLGQVTLTASVAVGRHVVLMPHVTLTHDVVVEDYATLCAGVSLGGSVQVGARAYVGMNASVRENLRVGRGSVLGMGSVLLQDQPDGQTWVGVPAAPLSGHASNQTSPARNRLRAVTGTESTQAPAGPRKSGRA